VAVPIVFTEGARGMPTVKLKDKGKVVTRYRNFPRLTPEQLTGLHNSLLAPPRIDELGNWVTPAYLIVDHKRKLHRENLNKRAATADRMLRDVQEAAKKMGKSASCKTYRQYLKLKAAFEEALDQEELGDAAKAFSQLKKLPDMTEVMDETIEPLTERFLEIGRMQMQEAVDNAKQHPRIAREILRDLEKQFKGTALEKEIRAAKRAIR
jgi:hypothetical protein